MWFISKPLPLQKTSLTPKTTSLTTSPNAIANPNRNPGINSPSPLNEQSTSSSNTIAELISSAPPQELATAPFCCPFHQIPTSCPTSETLTFFLGELATRRAQMHFLTEESLKEPLFPFNQEPSDPLPQDSTSPIQIVEFEILPKQANYLKRVYLHHYYVVGKEVEMRFREVSVKWFEQIKQKGKGNWAFAYNDEVVDDRVSWVCEICRWKYWVRLHKIEG